MRLIYIIIGFISLALGVIGIILPILPTTPFLLLTLYFFTKSSKRFEQWFTRTKLYEKYLKTFVEQRAMTKKQKWCLLIFVDIVILLSIIVASNMWVTISLVLLDAIKYLYFYTQVKTIKEV